MTGASMAMAATAGGRAQRLVHGYLHKTSNNLCGIKGYASLIAARADDGTATAWARKILVEVEQMEELYRSVEEIAFPHASTATGEDDLLASAAAALRAARCRHPRLRLRARLRRGGRLLLPARDLELVLAELIANSAEAVPEDELSPLVTLASEPGSPGRVALLVSDDGPGMPPALLREARNPFVSTKPGHLGVGLARVETLLDMYGLAWSVNSAPGQGTCVALDVAQDALDVVVIPEERKFHEAQA